MNQSDSDSDDTKEDLAHQCFFFVCYLAKLVYVMQLCYCVAHIPRMCELLINEETAPSGVSDWKCKSMQLLFLKIKAKKTQNNHEHESVLHSFP